MIVDKHNMRVVRKYHDNGELASERHYKGNKRHGRCRFYHNSGELYREAYYRDGKLHGPCKYHRENGELYRVDHYRNNREINIPEGVLPVESI